MKISVITPIYKGQKYINRLISMMYSNYMQFISKKFNDISVEYILVNDSPDKKINMDKHMDIFNKKQKSSILVKQKNINEGYIDIEHYYMKGFSVIFINNHTNSGIHQTRVNGLNIASGDYVMFLDQDDLILKKALIKLYEKATQTNADIVVANGYRRWNKKYSPLYKRSMAQSLVSKEDVYIYGTDMIFSPGQCFVKRSAIPEEWKCNILKQNGCDDCYLWLLMLDKGCNITTIKDKIYCHIENDDNYSNSYNAMEKSFFSMCDILEKSNDYNIKKVNTLRRRYLLKSYLKNEKSKIKKLINIIENLDIMTITIIYKVSGYH